MEISWFEIIAQIFNFFVLLFVLNYFFYKPVTKAMEDRKTRVFKAEKDAESKMKQAKMLMDNYENKIKNVEKEKQNIFASYKNQALEEKEQLLKDYKEEASEKRSLYLDEIENEKSNFLKRLREDIGKSAVDIAAKILSTISSKDLKDEVFKSFIDELEGLKNKELDADVFSKKTSFEVSSAKSLSEKEKTVIENALKANFDVVEGIEYNLDEDLILGYKLDLNTYTIHNSIKTYLDEVEDNILKLLESQQEYREWVDVKEPIITLK